MPYHLPRIDTSQLRFLANRPRNKRSCTEKRARTVVDSEVIKPRKSPYSPFDLLPVELQVEIFAQSLLPFPRGPLLISWVCAAWRAVVMSTPKLWSSFEIQIQGSGTALSTRDIRLMSTMEVWLERSRNYPLSIQIIHTPAGRVPDRRATQFLALLIPEARRWKHVQFILPAPSIAPLQEWLPIGFPALQSLTLQMRGIWDSSPNINILEIHIPWHSLTELDLQLGLSTRLRLDDCLTILSKTTNVIRCTMTAECMLGSENPDQGIVSLPMLESIHLILQGTTETDDTAISPNEPACLTRFLHLLSTPKLECLGLRWLLPWTETYSAVHGEFVKFLRGSTHTLTALTLAYFPTDESQLLECLEAVPGLTDLDLRFSLNDQEHDPITDQFLSSLNHPISVQPDWQCIQRRSPDMGRFPLPFLRSIHLQCQGDSYSNAALISLVESRWRALQPDGKFTQGRLRTFHSLFMNPVFGELEDRVKQWNVEGLDISMASLTVR